MLSIFDGESSWKWLNDNEKRKMLFDSIYFWSVNQKMNFYILKRV